MSRRRLWLLGIAASLAANGAGIALAYTSDHDPNALAHSLIYSLVGLSFVFAGLVAWARHPRNRTGRLMVLVGLALYLGSLADANDSIPFTIGAALGSLFVAIFVHVLVAYPSGVLHTRFERALVRFGYATAVLANLTPLLVRNRLHGCEGCPPSAINVIDSRSAEFWVDVFWAACGVVITVAALVIVIRRWRHASPPVRRALTPVLGTGAIFFVVLGITFALQTISSAASDVSGLFAFAAFFAVAWGFLIGLVRPRLDRSEVGRVLVDLQRPSAPHEIETRLRAAFRDPSLQLGLWEPSAQAYLGASDVLLDPKPTDGRVATQVDADDRPLALIVREPSPEEDEQFVQGILAAARLGLDLRARLQELTSSERRNRALLDAIPDNMFRVAVDGRYLDFHANVPEYLSVEPERIMGSTVQELLPEPAATLVLDAVRRAVDTGSLQTVEYRLMRRIGLRDVEARIAPSGEDEALIIVRDVTDRKQQDAELRASRQRLVEASDLERRRLERNLHDGAQQRLVSLSLALRLAHGRVRDDPDEAARLLSVASTELAQALEELRELARGIHPAVLSDRGLRAALEALADRAPVPVSFESPERRLPGPVEAAAYYVVAEALTNVAKYADASQVAVRVECENGTARVEVVDDGVGGADPTGGSGLRGLADRVAALDGRLEVESAAGHGTRVTAEIPCVS